MAIEKTYKQEGVELPKRGNMDVLEPMIDNLRNKTEETAIKAMGSGDWLEKSGKGKTTAIPQEIRNAPEQPHNLENAVEKLANNAIPADLTEKTGVDRTKMSQDITGILAELLKKDPSLLEDRKRLAETSANKFLKQPRGKEDLNTAEGRVAEGLRSYADKRAGFAVGDDMIKDGVPFVEEGLTTKIGKALDQKAMQNLQQALVLDDTVKARNNASALDLDGKNGVTVDEAKQSADNLKLVASQMPPQLKAELLKENAARQKSDPTGEKEAAEYEKITGVKMAPEAALVIRDAKAEGAKSPNPNATAQEAEEPAKDGKSPNKKNWLESLLDIIKPLLVALGFMEDEPKKETAVAANNPPADGKSTDGKGQAQQTQLTPEEKTKSLEYLAKLDESIQRDIKHAASQATGVGTVYAGKESGSELQVQTVSSSQQQPAQKSASL
ncbi:MAG: hypothetical protein ABL867_02560 [Rickettsiales bacterium]